MGTKEDEEKGGGRRMELKVKDVAPAEVGQHSWIGPSHPPGNLAEVKSDWWSPDEEGGGEEEGEVAGCRDTAGCHG